MSQMKEVLALLENCYGVLGNVRNQWEGRNTLAGQDLLIRLNSMIGLATGMSDREVRDNLDNGVYGPDFSYDNDVVRGRRVSEEECVDIQTRVNAYLAPNFPKEAGLVT